MDVGGQVVRLGVLGGGWGRAGVTLPPHQGFPEISTLPWFTLFAPLVCLLTIRATRDLVDDIVSVAGGRGLGRAGVGEGHAGGWGERKAESANGTPQSLDSCRMAWARWQSCLCGRLAVWTACLGGRGAWLGVGPSP